MPVSDDVERPEVIWAGVIDGEPSRVVSLPGKRLRGEVYNRVTGTWEPEGVDAGAPFVNPPYPRGPGAPYNAWDPPEA